MPRDLEAYPPNPRLVAELKKLQGPTEPHSYGKPSPALLAWVDTRLAWEIAEPDLDVRL